MSRDTKQLFSKSESFFAVLLMLGFVWIGRYTAFILLGNHWLGTLGISSLIVFSFLYLSKKNKLGYLGKFFNIWLQRIASKKHNKRFYIATIFTFYFFGSILAGIIYQDQQQVKKVETQIYQHLNIDNKTDSKIVLQKMTNDIKSNWHWYTPIIAFILMIGLPLYNFHFWALIVGVADHLLHGLFYTVSLISLLDYLEFVFIVIFNKWLVNRSK